MRGSILKTIGIGSILFFFVLINSTTAKASNIEKKVDILLKKHYKCQFNKPDSAVCYLNQALDIAEGYTNQTLRINTVFAWYYANRQINLDSSLVYINKAIALIPLSNDTFKIARAMTYSGHIYCRINDFKNGRIWQEKAIELKIISNDSTGLAHSYNLLANNYRNLANTSNKIGNDYRNDELYEKALSYYFKGLSLCNNKRCHAFADRNIGMVYMHMKAYSKAQFHFKNSIETYENLNYTKGVVLSRAKLGTFYSATGKYHKALEEYKFCEDYYIKKEKKNNVIPLHRNIAKAYLGLGEFKKAEESALHSLNESKRRNRDYGQLETISILEKIYAQQEQFEEAYKYQKQYQLLKDTFSYDEIKNELLNQNLIKEINTNKMNLQLVKQENIIANKDAKVLRLGISIVIISSVLLFVLGLQIYQKRIKKLAQRIKVETNKTALVSQALEKEKKVSNQLQTEMESYIRQLSETDGAIDVKMNKEAIKKLYQLRILTNEDWTEFKRLFLNVNPRFFDKLKKDNSNISAGDLKVAALARLNFNNNETGKMMAISAESVRKAKYRLRQKLQIEDNKALQNYIFSL